MIATPDPTAAPEVLSQQRRLLSPGSVLARLIIAVTGLLFMMGAFAGYNDARGAAPMDRADWILTAIAATAAIGLMWLIIDTLRRRDPGDGPMPPRERFSNRVLAGSAVVGMLIAAGVQFDQLAVMLTTATLPLWAAGAAALVLLVAAPAVTIWWMRGIDELERDAYVSGGNVAAHVMLFGIPALWIASRTGLIGFRPEIVLTLASLIWCAVWLRSKY
jgi:hypothetical protein